jgi:hypothetical protein
VKARAVLEQLLGESKTVRFDAFVTLRGEDDVPVVVDATCAYNEGAPGSLGNEPGWYADIDAVTTDGGDVVTGDIDEPTRARLAAQALRQLFR